MDRWQGHVAVVTGASSGIGIELVRGLVAAGMRVVGLARRVERLEELKAKLAPGTFHPFKCDLTKESDILAAFKYVDEHVGPLHVLINNAGYLVSETIIGEPLSTPVLKSVPATRRCRDETEHPLHSNSHLNLKLNIQRF